MDLRIILVPAALMIVWGLSGVLTGRISMKNHPGPVERRDKPGLFWLAVGSYIGVGLMMIGLWLAIRPPSRVDLRAMMAPAAESNQGGRACLGQDRCIVVYVAPWCDACRSMHACTKALVRAPKRKANALSVFVGADQGPALQAMASDIGPNTFVDSESSVREELRISSFPTFALLDGKGRVLKRFAGVPEPCDLTSVETLLDLR
jgi:hypothetical protein